MKALTIESMIAIHYPATALAYVQIINTIVSSDTRNDLREGLKRLKRDTNVDDFFEWGFGRCHFWLHQRMGYQAPNYSVITF